MRDLEEVEEDEKCQDCAEDSGDGTVLASTVIQSSLSADTTGA